MVTTTNPIIEDIQPKRGSIQEVLLSIVSNYSLAWHVLFIDKLDACSRCQVQINYSFGYMAELDYQYNWTQNPSEEYFSDFRALAFYWWVCPFFQTIFLRSLIHTSFLFFSVNSILTLLKLKIWLLKLLWLDLSQPNNVAGVKSNVK